MKNIARPLLIIVILISGFSSATAQKKEKKKEQFQEMKALIESSHYEFRVTSIQPSGAKTIHPTSEYTLVAKDTIFTARLPYFGRAYQASYGGDGGIKFEEKPQDLKITLNEKKLMINIQFKIKTQKENYDLSMSVGSSGFTTLNINSQKRQTISYRGNVYPLKKE